MLCTRKWGTALWTLFQPPVTFSFSVRFLSGFRCLRGFVLFMASTSFNSGFDLARIEEVAVKTGVFSFLFALVTTFWTLFFHLDTFCYGETLKGYSIYNSGFVQYFFQKNTVRDRPYICDRPMYFGVTTKRGIINGRNYKWNTPLPLYMSIFSRQLRADSILA